MASRLATCALLLALSACASGGGGGGPIDPVPPVFDLAFMVCEDKPCADGGKPIAARVEIAGQSATTNQFGFVEFKLKAGVHTVTVTADGYYDISEALTVPGPARRNVVMKALIPPLERVRIEGRYFVPRLVFVSGLTLLTKTPEERAAFLDWAKATGFNGARVFAGALTWAGQSPESARAALPDALNDAQRRGLYLYVVINTDSGTGYDVEAHTSAVVQLCDQSPACILEGANEIGHPTQSSKVNDIPWLTALMQRLVPNGIPWSVGAVLGLDEGQDYPASGGKFVTAHLDRGRDKWNQVRRVREIYGITEGKDQPAMSGEPIGAAEQSSPGRRESDPAFFYAYGALCRLFEIGCVFHSEQGLQAEPHTNNQQDCARAFVAGTKALERGDRLTYKNSGWHDSPVKSFSGAVRAYSGVAGDWGFTVVVGAEPNLNIEWQNGWQFESLVGEMPGVIVMRIHK